MLANVASKGGLANRQLPSGKKSHSNSSSDCGLDESEDEQPCHDVGIINSPSPPQDDNDDIESPYTNGHYRHKVQQQPVNTSPLYAQVNKDRDNTRNDLMNQHSTIPNTYRGLQDTTSHGSYASELNSSYDSIIETDEKLNEALYTEHWSRNKPTRGFKMPFADELNQVLAENKG